MVDFLRLRLGTTRLRALVLLLALTGLASLVLNAFDAEALAWVTPVQTLLALSVPAGAVIILLAGMEPSARTRWLAILIPVAGALLLIMVVEQGLRLPLAGVALGWMLAGWFLFRPRQPRQVQQAIRAMRRGDHEAARAAMDALIGAEPDVPAHYRLRAEMHRLAGDLAGAQRDYRHMTRLAAQDAGAWNGLAEVLLQAGRHEAAHEAALRAHSLAAGDWVAGYNLGMIEDRLNLPQEALQHVGEALAVNVPDARHRLLLRLYQLRALMRLGDRDGAANALQHLQAEHRGLAEWQTLLAHEQAEPLRRVLAQDVELAQALMEDDISPECLIDGPAGGSPGT